MSKTIKYKKQFRLYDIYRRAVMLEESHIEGIDYYTVDSKASVIRVKFVSDAIIPHCYTATNEEELKEIVRKVNTILGNCQKPGPRRRRR